MNIRGKLTLSFLAIVSLIFITASITIYGFSADYRRDSYYTRLISKANNTAKLLFEVDQVDAALLKKLEKDNLASLPKERVEIYNDKNEILFTTDEEGVLNADTDMLNRIREGNDVRYVSGEFECVGFIFPWKDENYVVSAGAVDVYGIKRLQYLRRNLFIVNAISFLIVFISGWMFSGQALAPIKQVISRVNEISASNLDLRVDEGNGTDEIARLAMTFNQMLDRLENAFKMEKNLIANASHEIRTPLTAITGQLEVNLMKERTNEEYKATFQSLLDDIKNLNSISDKLLMLAQASAGSEKLNFKPIRIDEILWQVKTELHKQRQGYKVNIDLSSGIPDDKALTVMGNEQLLKTALSNLADNGCKYSPDHQVQINLSSNGADNLNIRFHDNGIGVKGEDIQQLFEPFFRGSNAAQFKGHGIGLSLANRIITLHNGKIEVEPVAEAGTTFCVSLPTAS